MRPPIHLEVKGSRVREHFLGCENDEIPHDRSLVGGISPAVRVYSSYDDAGGHRNKVIDSGGTGAGKWLLLKKSVIGLSTIFVSVENTGTVGSFFLSVNLYSNGPDF